MVFQWLASEQYLGTVQFHDSINMFLDTLVVPCEYWATSEILEVSLCCLCCHFVDKVGFAPVTVHEHD